MEELIEICNDWVRSVYPQFESRASGKQNFNGNYITIEESISDNLRFWKMKRSEEGKKDIGKIFENFIFIAKNDKKIEFSLLQNIIFPIERITPEDVSVFPPWVINKIIDRFECKLDGSVMSSNWSTISPSNISNLIEKISNPDRRLPIIVMSKSWETKKSIIKKPGKLSNKLAGLADVFILSDPNTKQLGDVFGQQWLSNGTLRIFWPGSGVKENLQYNPAWENMYSKRRLKKDFDNNIEILSQDIINKICLATRGIPASSDFVKKIRKKIEENELKIEEQNQKEERDRILTKINNSSEKIEYFEEEIERKNARYSKLDIENKKNIDIIEEKESSLDGLRHQLSQKIDENKALRAVTHALEEMKKRKPDATADDLIAHLNVFGIEEDDGPEPEPEFRSILQALENAKSEFSRIKILPSAFDSAKKTNSDADPNEVYEVLRMLNDNIWPEIKNDIERNKKTSLRKNIHAIMEEYFSGKMYAETESNKTMNKYKKEFNHKGRYFQIEKNKKIRMKSHLRLGTSSNPLRIHLICLNDKSSYDVVEESFSKDGKKKKKQIKNQFNNFPKIIIGWCGDHLPVANN
ncbi:MAG: hypothetical protein HOI55_11920 [Candidatus Marinimicrobia bacterium]|jgi:uncharacterized protein (DUF2267 family)|nr:hypothetical protein [Candidatus Neomarinimicrobiota bacterium]